MWNKKFWYKLFFLTLILVLPLAFQAMAFEDAPYATSTEDLTVSTTLPTTEVDNNLELDLETNDLDILSTEVEPVKAEPNSEVSMEIGEVIGEVVEVSTSTLNTNVDENPKIQDLSALTAEDIEKDVEKEQAGWIQSNNKYKQIKKDETDGKYEVHEYQTPNGETGYQIFYYDESGRVIESKGYGIESESRTWTKTYPTFTTTTT